VAGLVEVEEGPWLLTRLLTVPDEELAVGSGIQICVVPGAEEGEALVLSCTPAFSTLTDWPLRSPDRPSEPDCPLAPTEPDNR
jgi:hypothetical protein